MIGQCLICVRSESQYIANKVVKKELSHEDAAKELSVKLPEWLSHYELHVRRKLINVIANDIEPIKNNLLNKIQEGTESLNRVIKLTKSISSKLENEDVQRNIRLIQAYAQLERNVISGLKELAILEGDISVATTVNNYNNTVKVDKLMSIVMEDATPAFKENLLKKLEVLEVSNAN